MGGIGRENWERIVTTSSKWINILSQRSYIGFVERLQLVPVEKSFYISHILCMLKLTVYHLQKVCGKSGWKVNKKWLGAGPADRNDIDRLELFFFPTVLPKLCIDLFAHACK